MKTRAPNLTPEELRLVDELEGQFDEEARLEREGKLRPWSKHLQAKMDSGSATVGPDDPIPFDEIMTEGGSQEA